MTDASSWRVRLEGHLALLGLPLVMLVVAFRHAQGPIGFDYLRFLLGAFPAAVGWLVAVIAFEIRVARGDGRAAIRFGLSVCALTAVVNLLLVLFVATP